MGETRIKIPTQYISELDPKPQGAARSVHLYPNKGAKRVDSIGHSHRRASQPAALINGVLIMKIDHAAAAAAAAAATIALTN